MWFNSNTTGGSGIGYIPTAQVNPWLLPVLGFTASDLQEDWNTTNFKVNKLCFKQVLLTFKNVNVYIAVFLDLDYMVSSLNN
jgi:hypothetical protein